MPLPDYVKGALDDVLSENQDKIIHFWQTAGGWEGWLQCELSYRLMQSEVNVEREVDVWNNGEKADLYFPHVHHIIELKAPGLKRLQTSQRQEGSFGALPSAIHAVLTEIHDDLRKVDNYNGPGHSIVVIANTTRPEMAEIALRLRTHLPYTSYGVGQVVDESIPLERSRQPIRSDSDISVQGNFFRVLYWPP